MISARLLSRLIRSLDLLHVFGRLFLEVLQAVFAAEFDFLPFVREHVRFAVNERNSEGFRFVSSLCYLLLDLCGIDLRRVVTNFRSGGVHIGLRRINSRQLTNRRFDAIRAGTTVHAFNHKM